MQGLCFRPENPDLSLQDTDRPHWHQWCLSILHHINEFKYMLFRKHWGGWPPTPLFPSFSARSLHDLLLIHCAGYIAPCSADRRCNWVMLQQLCRGNRTFALGLWTSIPQGDLQGDAVRLPKVTAEHLMSTRGMFRSKMKEGGTRMRFIHLNKVDHQTDVAAEVLVRQRKEEMQGGREGRGVKQSRGDGEGWNKA